MRAIQHILIIFLMLSGMTAVANEESYGPTQEELAMLPPYCGGPGGGDWKRILGPEGTWNNHTCYGINRLNRYYRSRSAGERKYHLQTALDDFNYSVSHLPQNFPLMPEILYYRGVTLKLQGTIALAMADWQKSIGLDKHYVRSIQELADLFAKNLDKPEKALEVVTEGLRDNPNVKSLQKRYTRYGGKLPYPEPRVAAKEVPAEAPAVQAGPDNGHKDGDPADVAKSDATNATQVPAKTQDVAPPHVIGVPGDPWCRFCP